MKTRRVRAYYKAGLLLCTIGLAVPAGYGLRVLAEGAPTTQPLFYSGTLEVEGKLADGPHTITLSFFDTETSQSVLCTSSTSGVPVQSGRFRMAVSDDCVGTMRSKPDLWVGFKFTGADGVPHELPTRSKVGAVPYAMEAQHAVNSSSANAASGALASQVVPSGAVMAFNLDACPSGWSPFGAAEGRAVIGTTAGVALGAKVGTDSVTLTSNELPSHTHGITDPGHNHGANTSPDSTHFMIFRCRSPSLGFASGSSWGSNSACPGGTAGLGISATTASSTTGITATSSAGTGAPFDNRQASVALLYCQKN